MGYYGQSTRGQSGQKNAWWNQRPISTQAMGFPTNAPSYPGGATGEQADYDLRAKFAGGALDAYLGNLSAGYNSALEMRNQIAGTAASGLMDSMLTKYNGQVSTNNAIRERAAGMAGRDQLNQAANAVHSAARMALGGVGSLNEGIAGLMKQSEYYTPEMREQLKADAYQQANNAATAERSNLNTALASRGMSGNPFASAALGMQGQANAGYARGRAGIDVAKLDAENRLASMQAAGGLREALSSAYGNAGQIDAGAAQYYAAPDRESALALLQNETQPDMGRMTDLYRQYEGLGPEAPDLSGAQTLFQEWLRQNATKWNQQPSATTPARLRRWR